jgi:hypothetical protein
MPKYNLITPNDYTLSFEATGVLATMLNLPESDYHTAEELCAFFENDSPKAICKALNELTDADYLLQVGRTYAVNKLKITGMQATPHKDCCADAKSDFSSDCTMTMQE